MLGTIVNAGAIILGCAAGLLLRRGIPERVTDAVMKGIGLCVIYIGVSGALNGEKTIAMIIAMAAGGAIGTALDLNGGMERLGRLLEEKLARGGSGLSAGFVTASLIYCVGAMAVVGSLQSGLTGSHDMLFTKSLLDGISAIVLTASLGMGVGLSAVSVLIYQGAITLLAGLLAPVLTDGGDDLRGEYADIRIGLEYDRRYEDKGDGLCTRHIPRYTPVLCAVILRQVIAGSLGEPNNYRAFFAVRVVMALRSVIKS